MSPLITIDGGPHTLWWPTRQRHEMSNSSRYARYSDEFPPSQIIHALQPQAKFIISLCNPVKRLYSDYHFLADDSRPVKRAGDGTVSTV